MEPLRMTLGRAISIATSAHDGQEDKQGQPYILHCLRVMLALAENDDRIVGVLHDVLEDTGLTLADLRAGGLSEELSADLAAITRLSGETYTGYILRCSSRPRSLRVKLADLNDNLGRLEQLSVTEQGRLGPRYYEARALLLSLSAVGAASSHRR